MARVLTCIVLHPENILGKKICHGGVGNFWQEQFVCPNNQEVKLMEESGKITLMCRQS